MVKVFDLKAGRIKEMTPRYADLLMKLQPKRYMPVPDAQADAAPATLVAPVDPVPTPSVSDASVDLNEQPVTSAPDAQPLTPAQNEQPVRKTRKRAERD